MLRFPILVFNDIQHSSYTTKYILSNINYREYQLQFNYCLWFLLKHSVEGFYRLLFYSQTCVRNKVLVVIASVIIINPRRACAERVTDHLIEVESLINNHPDCCVIIEGDFNAHVAVAGNLRGNSSQNSHGNLLSHMVCRNDLFLSSLSNNTSGPCYTYFSGDTRTTTDYFIVDACLAQFIQKSAVLDHHPLNFSDHLPLMMSLSICPSTNPRVSPTYRRLNWKHASTDGSVDMYTSTFNNLITPFVNKVYSSTDNLDTDVVSITHILQEAAVATIPLLGIRKRKSALYMIVT